jgi:adenine-specific DNA-methyltransferase
MSNFDALVAKLREVFQIDRPDLDFGVYRILNARAGEIEDYLSNRLKARVAEALAAGAAANTETLRDEIAKAEKSAQELGISADQLPKVQQLRAQLAAASAGASEHENQVFSHLLTFFSRYYDKGDFISQRRYKGDTYAIPYSGEEVVLHWANRDQYYTKSGETFSNFSFRLDDGRAVHFRLVAADTAKDNRKDNDKTRCFVLATARTVTRTDEEGETFEETIQPVAEEDGALVIRFDYAPQPKGTKQEALVDQAVAAILDDETIKTRWLALTTRAPTDKKPNRTLLEKHLTTYTQKNSADYFIHKDLGGFLRRELDFYIKNEVINLDDVQGAEAFSAIEKNLRMIQCLRAIALDLIAFLASIENFQKKLWLKKKFVVAAHYCVTLDRVPEALYPAIAANPAQWAQWHDLGMRASSAVGTVEDLKAAPFLMVDTAMFDAGFRAELLKAIRDLDASLDGLLVHGDNFQALGLLGERYREKVNCIYIDPPYNTGKDAFRYKDGYQRSSWACLLRETLSRAIDLASQESLTFISNDDNENENLKKVLRDCGFILKTNLVWNSEGHTDNQFEIKVNHEYVTLAQKSQRAIYGNVIDPNTRAESNLWKNIAENSITKNGPANPFSEVVLPKGFPVSGKDGTISASVPHDDFFAELGDTRYFPRNLNNKYDVTFPIRYNSVEFKDGKTSGEIRVCAGWANLNKLQLFIDGSCVPITEDDGVLTFYITPKGTIYYRKEKSAARNIVSVLRNFSTTEKMKYVLEDMGLHFDYPKPLDLISYILKIGDSPLSLDFFAGSGTTAHSIIHLNKADGGSRRYVLIESAEHLGTVIIPRVKKVVFSADWKDGKPTTPETGISHAFKVLKIEGYEDTLNNLDLKRSDAQASLLEGFSAGKRDDYLMRYMLDVEARGSLLSVADFRKPFDYTLKVAVDSVGAWEERKVDLVETFNYLIGLTVQHIDYDLKRGFATVVGQLPAQIGSTEKTLVFWRDCDKIGYEELERRFKTLNINPSDSEYEIVYVNGDHNIPSVIETTEDEGSVIKKLMLRQIEPAFLDAMFNVDDV